AVLVDGAQGSRGNTQLHPPVLGGHPEAALVQVGEEAAAGLVVRVRDVVARLHALAGDLADAGHGLTPWGCTKRDAVGGPHCPGTVGLAARHGTVPEGPAWRSEPGIMPVRAAPAKRSAARAGAGPARGCRPP